LKLHIKQQISKLSNQPLIMAGRFMSNMISNNSNIESKKETFGTVHSSATTNSYSKCLDGLIDKFDDKIIDKVRELIQKYDQSSFHETYVYGQLYSDESGELKVIGKKVLHVEGTYSFRFIAHLKTLKIWVQIDDINE
jgi:hypothetical protein